MKTLKEGKKGITLIALVITIIVLLILAGISIAMLTGDNGILTQAAKAKKETEKAQVDEANTLAGYEQIINVSSGVNLETITGYETSNTITQDSLGNRVVVPAGFRVVNPGDNVEDGIVIEDVSHESTKGSQFVWIPVGKNIKKVNNLTFDVTLKRYVFNSDASINENLTKIEPTEQLKTSLPSSLYYTEELEKSTITPNTHAKNIKDFISKVNSTGGFYLARYEARDGTANSERTDSTNDTNQLICTANNFVYNFVTQPQAASLSQNMYTDTNFTSDLVNSYVWGTALVFIQQCSDDNGYSQQTSLNDVFLSKGTINDNKCNIYDMASNCWEWTTETRYGTDGYTWVAVGGYYSNTNTHAADRGYTTTPGIYNTHSFRPIIYL